MANRKHRKPLDLAAVRPVSWSWNGRRYRLVLSINPKKDRARIAEAFDRVLTRVLEGYNDLWKDGPMSPARLKLAVMRLRQSKKPIERTPASIGERLGIPAWKVERIIYGPHRGSSSRTAE